jgi:hypothetical protein
VGSADLIKRGGRETKTSGKTALVLSRGEGHRGFWPRGGRLRVAGDLDSRNPVMRKEEGGMAELSSGARE